MSRLVWDDVGQKKYELGNRHLALYVTDENGGYTAPVAWNGITSFTVSNTGGDETALWADDIKYGSLRSNEECGGTVESYQCPREFYPCDGSVEVVPGMAIGQQNRRPFGLVCRTTIGNDVRGLEFGYKLHIIYGATASPSERPYTTINDSPDAQGLSWEFSCVPVNVTGYKPVAHIEIDSTLVETPANLAVLEDILFGTDANATAGTAATDGRLPTPDEISYILDHGEAMP